MRAFRDPLETEFFTKQADIDTKALKLYKKSPKKAKKFLTDYTWKSMEQVVNMYKRLRHLLISKYTNNKQGS